MRKPLIVLLLLASINSLFLSTVSSATSSSDQSINISKKTLDFTIYAPQSDGGYHDGLLLAIKSDGKIVYYNVNGTVAFDLPPDVVPVSDFYEQRAIVRNSKTNLVGYINTKGDLVTPIQYEQAEYFSEGVAYVKLNDKQYLIDRFGKEEINLTNHFSSNYEFKDGLALAFNEGKVGFFNKKEQVIVPFKYNSARDFSEGLAVVEDAKGNYGYVNTDGKVVIPLQYKSGGDFSEGLAPVQNESGLWGFINKTGKVIIPFRYASVGDFSEGLAAVYNRVGKLGYINPKGKLIINYMKYTSGSRFKEGFALVGIGDNSSGKFGFINRNGVLVTKLEYKAESSLFRNGVAVGYKSQGIAYILTKHTKK